MLEKAKKQKKKREKKKKTKQTTRNEFEKLKIFPENKNKHSLKECLVIIICPVES